MNKHGQRTAELIGTLESDIQSVETSGPLDPEIPNADVVTRLQEHIEAGREFEDAWRCATHGEGDDLPPRAALAFKRSWEGWYRNAATLDSSVRTAVGRP
jgi:hypothetical protein